MNLFPFITSRKAAANIRDRGWSYMGLEMILDTVKTLEGEDLDEYLRNL